MHECSYCRDESCHRIDLHPAHAVTAIRVTEAPSTSPREPWKRSAPRALDHSIAKATSKTYPRHFKAILREVEEDYGECIDRTVARRLARLVKRGHILRIDLGRHLYAYLRPGSSLVNDVDLIREQLEAMFASSVPEQHAG
jgi:predicted transcriptional regulator